MSSLQDVPACHEDLERVGKTKLAIGEPFPFYMVSRCAAETLPASTPFQGWYCHCCQPAKKDDPKTLNDGPLSDLYARTLSKAVEHARGCVAINIGRFDMVMDVYVSWESEWT